MMLLSDTVKLDHSPERQGPTMLVKAVRVRHQDDTQFRAATYSCVHCEIMAS